MIGEYEFIPGFVGLEPDDIAHLIVPGRYRSPDGMGPSALTTQRADTAGNFFLNHELDLEGGVVIPSGYKSPRDTSGETWSDGDEDFMGKPEAYSMQEYLRDVLGVPAEHIIVEPHSVDTVSNLTHSRNLLPDRRPVGIVSQRPHLERILNIIAPRVINQRYAGIVVPELPFQPDRDKRSSSLASRWLVRGFDPQREDLARVSDERIEHLWRAVDTAKAIGNHALPKSMRFTNS